MRIQSLLVSRALQDSRRGLRSAGRAAFIRLSASIPRREARIVQFLFVCAALALVCTARADTLTLANGDRLTGTIVKSDGKVLTLQTDYAGAITLQWSAVRQLTSTAPLYVVTPQGATVGGIVTTEGADLVVTPATGAPERIPLANAAVIRSQADETSYERSLHPGLLEGWQTNTSLGFALARGNSRTTNLNFGFNAARTTLHDKLTAYVNSIYASSGLDVAPGVTAGVTADDIRGGSLYQHNIRDRAYAYGSADFEYNELQFLNLRSILGLGAGYHLIQQPNTTLDVFAGGNYTRESYSIGILRSVAALTLGDTLKHQLGKNSTLNETFELYPQVTQVGPYRFSLDMNIATKIRNWIGWQNTVSDHYISDPVPGTVSNDFIFSTGFNFTFNH